MDINDTVLIRATIFDTPDPEADEPNDRFYTLAIDGTASSGGRELVAVYERDINKVTVESDPLDELYTQFAGAYLDGAPSNDLVQILDNFLTARGYPTVLCT